MVAVSQLHVKKWRWGKSQISQSKLSAPKYCEIYVVFHCQNDLETQQIYGNKLTLSSGTLMFRLKEKFSVFRKFFDQWNFSVEDCIFWHCSALEWTNIFVQSNSDITFHAIECGVTTCLGDGKSCHMWLSIIKWSLTTIMLRLKEIWHCSIVARGSLKTLAYHSLSKYWIQKIRKSYASFISHDLQNSIKKRPRPPRGA